MTARHRASKAVHAKKTTAHHATKASHAKKPAKAKKAATHYTSTSARHRVDLA